MGSDWYAGLFEFCVWGGHERSDYLKDRSLAVKTQLAKMRRYVDAHMSGVDMRIEVVVSSGDAAELVRSYLATAADVEESIPVLTTMIARKCIYEVPGWLNNVRSTANYLLSRVEAMLNNPSYLRTPSKDLLAWIYDANILLKFWIHGDTRQLDYQRLKSLLRRGTIVETIRNDVIRFDFRYFENVLTDAEFNRLRLPANMDMQLTRFLYHLASSGTSDYDFLRMPPPTPARPVDSTIGLLFRYYGSAIRCLMGKPYYVNKTKEFASYTPEYTSKKLVSMTTLIPEAEVISSIVKPTTVLMSVLTKVVCGELTDEICTEIRRFVKRHVNFWPQRFIDRNSVASTWNEVLRKSRALIREGDVSVSLTPEGKRVLNLRQFSSARAVFSSISPTPGPSGTSPSTSGAGSLPTTKEKPTGDAPSSPTPSYIVFLYCKGETFSHYLQSFKLPGESTADFVRRCPPDTFQWAMRTTSYPARLVDNKLPDEKLADIVSTFNDIMSQREGPSPPSSPSPPPPPAKKQTLQPAPISVAPKSSAPKSAVTAPLPTAPAPLAPPTRVPTTPLPTDPAHVTPPTRVLTPPAPIKIIDEPPPSKQIKLPSTRQLPIVTSTRIPHSVVNGKRIAYSRAEDVVFMYACFKHDRWKQLTGTKVYGVILKDTLELSARTPSSLKSRAIHLSHQPEQYLRDLGMTTVNIERLKKKLGHLNRKKE